VAPPAPPFPRTLPALITAIRDVLPAVPAAVKAYRNLGHQLGGGAMAPGPLYAARHPGARPKPALNRKAGDLALRFAEYVASLPLVADQLETLHQKTAAPVTADPLYRSLGAGGWVDTDHVMSTSGDISVVELGSDLPVPIGAERVAVEESAGPYVPWWPTVPPEYGGTVADCPTDALQHVELGGLADTMPLLRGRAEGFDQLARRIAGGRGPTGTARRTIRAANRRYEGWVTAFEPLTARVAAETAAYLNTTSAAIAALIDDTEGDLPMPVLASSAAVTSLAGRIRDAITAGHGGRLSVSDSEVAFAWAPGQAATLLSYLSSATVTGRHTTVVTAKNAATVAGPVAEGAAKPTGVVDFTSDEVDLVKYAGIATLSTESAQFTANIEAALSSVLVSQIVRSIEKDAVTAITAAAGVKITAAADITAGVLSAIAGIRENGGAPNVVGLSSADWLSIMTATGSSGFLNFAAETGPAGTWLGLSPVILPGQPTGSAVVVDGSTVSVLEPAGGPLCVVDVFSLISVNKVQVAVEEFATTQVTSPGGVATVAVT